MAPTASRRPSGSSDRGAVGPGQASEHSGIDADGASALQHLQQLAAARRLGIAGVARSVELIAGCHQHRQRSRRIAQHHEERSLTSIGEVDRRLKQSLREAAVADRCGPYLVLRLEVEQMPARVAEAEHLHALGEQLDLMGRAEHDADVPIAGGRERVRSVRRRTGHVEARSRVAPANVDHVEDEPRAIQQVHRFEAVRETVERLDGGQCVGVAERLIVRHGRGGPGFLLVEDQHTGRNRPVLIARHRRDAQHLDRRRHPVRARGRARRVRRLVEKRADIPVLDRAPEQLAALEHLLRIEDRTVAEREHGANRPRQPHLVLRERTARRHVQHVPRSEPPDGQL